MPKMSRRRQKDSDQSPDAAPLAKVAFLDTHRGRAVLVGLSVILLTLAYAPLGQFYLAWVGLAPWLVLVGRARTAKSLFWWSWLAGIGFFAVNMWWLVFVTAPGALALVVYLGLWFGLSALVIRGTGLLSYTDERLGRTSASSVEPSLALPADSTELAESTESAVRRNAPALRPILAVFFVAALWAAQEWVRGNLFTGLPWLYLGHTQTPLLAMCQVADFASAYGVTFWVVMVNVLVALVLLHRPRWTHLVPAAAAVSLVLVLTLAYGILRMRQEQMGSPGPVVMVVQPNYPQDNTGSKGASTLELVNFHIRTTRDALVAMQAKGQPLPDLVVWSETMMPEINKDYRQYLKSHGDPRKQEAAELLELVHKELVELSERFRINLLTGGIAMMSDRTSSEKQRWNRFNSAYLFDPSGRGAAWRYDKIHLVPFGEFIPFRETFPPLYKFFNLFNPYESDYTVTQGKELTVFAILPRGDVPPATAPSRAAAATVQPAISAAPYRFVAPICFEDIDSRLVAEMFRGEGAAGAGAKRAHFIVNLTNDGWFRANEMPQHFQVAIFRSIENRVPTARSVNTGISGFIDPVGRTHDLIGPGKVGVATARLTIDRRLTLYTRYGDVFAGICLAVVGSVSFVMLWRWMKNRRRVGR
jgi:apolipoprotein N-acyltransferase